MPSEMVAAFLAAQLEHAEKIINNRCQIFQLYHRLLSPLAEKKRVRLRCLDKQNTNNGHIFYMLVATSNERSGLIEFLQKRNIHSVFHYTPLHSSHAGKKYGRIGSSLQNTDELSQRVIRLPLFYEMCEDDVKNVVEAINTFYSEKDV